VRKEKPAHIRKEKKGKEYFKREGNRKGLNTARANRIVVPQFTLKGEKKNKGQEKTKKKDRGILAWKRRPSRLAKEVKKKSPREKKRIWFFSLKEDWEVGSRYKKREDRGGKLESAKISHFAQKNSSGERNYAILGKY